MRWLLILLAAILPAQHIRVKTDPAADLGAIATFRLEPGRMSGFHPRLNEATLREHLEARLLERVQAIGLRPASRPDAVLTYSLRAVEEKESERRGGKRVEHEATRYELEIRLLGAAGKPVWTAIATGSVRDRRQRFVEVPILRAVTLALAKLPR